MCCDGKVNVLRMREAQKGVELTLPKRFQSVVFGDSNVAFAVGR